MSERDTPTDSIERRSVLAAVATGLGGVGVAQSSLAGAQDASQYVIEQGDRCVPITPLSGDGTVEEFYDYRTPNTEPSGEAYSSYGTTDLQRPETSICFLYDGPEGLSLVVVHDELEDGTNGGAVTFDLRFENPDRGSWIVGDDDYDAPSNYDTFEQTADGWRIDWTWAEGRSDGGAYRPLGDEFAVTIHPAFGENAALHGEYYDGEITDWEVLSGDRSDPDRVPLALDQPLTIRAGDCGGGQTTTTTRTTTEQETTTEEDTTTEEETTEEEQSSGTVRADVEIVPGKVNPRSHGRLPVVVYSTGDFDATALAPGSVAFGPSDATPVHHTRTDEDGDGRADLKLHFRMDATGIDWDTDRVRLTGETESGRTVVGDAAVQLVPAGDDDDDEDESEEREHEEEAEDEKEDDEEEEEGEREREREEEDDEDDDDDDDEKDDDDDEKEDDDWEDEREDDDDERDDDDDERDRGNGNGRGRGNGRDDDRDEDD